MHRPIPYIRDNTPEEEAEIQRQIAGDPDTWEATGDLPPDAEERRRRKIERHGVGVELRIDRDVLDAFMARDPEGWRARINETLREALGLDRP